MSADRIVATVCCLLLLPAAAWTAYDMGKAHGVSLQKPCEQKVVRATYSTEELQRIIRARKRMEAVK